MMATKSILMDLQNMQRKFIWSGTQDPQKWALVKWDIVCTPKSQGGMGIRDPEKESIVVGDKIWWHWVTHTLEPWAKLWHAKYVEGWNCRDLI